MLDLLKSKLCALRDRLAMSNPELVNLYVLFKVDRWILLAISIVFVLVGIVGVSVLKLWRTTPEHFDPVIKVSWLDYIQAWNLERKAQQEIAANNHEAAFGTLSVAIANDPGNADLYRLQLGVIQQRLPSLDLGRECLFYGSWLLGLTQTNRFDLEHLVNSMEHCRLYGEIVSSLETEFEAGSSPLQASYLRAVFEQGQYSRFRDLWNLHGKAFDGDRLMGLYAKGVDMIEDPESADLEGFRSLYQTLRSDPVTAVRAGHVAVRVFAAKGFRPHAKQALTDLIRRRQANVPDHLAYWLLLLRLGQESTIEYHSEEVGQPANVIEALLLANLLRTIGEEEASRPVAEAALMAYGGLSEQIWLDYGNMLTRHQSWSELHDLAQRAQNQVGHFELPSVGRFWEALIAWKMNRPDRAEEAFNKLADLPPESEQLRLEMANALLALGQSEAADRLLMGIKGDSDSIRLYWLRRVNESLKASDPSVFHVVASRAHESSPHEPVHISNLASAVLRTRKDPQKALELTEQLMERNAEFIPYQLNYVHALIQANRLEKAELQLASLAVAEKSGPIQADYELAEFELAVAKRVGGEIVSRFRRLNTEGLPAETVRWVQDAVAPYLVE
jgi:tetratricopeptide (TPR) repeat protein